MSAPPTVTAIRAALWDVFLAPHVAAAGAAFAATALYADVVDEIGGGHVAKVVIGGEGWMACALLCWSGMLIPLLFAIYSNLI